MNASVMLVEDDNITRIALEDRLTGADYGVETFTEAVSAWTRFQERPTDVVITEYSLSIPGRNLAGPMTCNRR